MKSNTSTMTVAQLMTLLCELPYDTPVHVWVDGERYPIASIDPFYPEDEAVDINVRVI